MPPRAEVPPPDHLNDDEGVDPAENEQDEPAGVVVLLPDMIESFQNHLDDAPFLEEGLQLLSMVAQLPGEEVVLVRAGAVQRVLAVLDRHQDNERLVSLVLILLMRMEISDASGEEEERVFTSAVQDANGVSSICAAMECHENSEEIQSLGAVVLSCLLVHDALKNAVIQANGISKIVKAMALLPNDAQLHSMANQSFLIVLERDGSTMKEILVDAGIIPALLHSIKQCTESVSGGAIRTLSLSLLVVAGLGEDHERNKSTVLELEGIPTIVHVMENHYSNADIAMRALTATFFLMTDRSDIRDAFVAAGIAAPLNQIMRFHEQNSLAINASIRILADLTRDCSAAADAMVKVGVLSTIMKIVSHHINDAELISLTLIATTIICLHELEFSSIPWVVVDSMPQLIHSMFEVMRAHSTHQERQLLAITIIRRLSSSYAQCRRLNQLIITPNDLATLVCVMKQFPESGSMHGSVCGLFDTLASVDGGMAKPIQDSGFCLALSDVIRRHSSSEDTEFLVDALTCLLKLVNVHCITKEDIANVDGFVALLESLEESTSSSVSHTASAVLSFDSSKT